MAGPAGRFRRALELQRTLEERCYTRRGSTDVGPVFFHDDYPLKWDLNFVRVERDASFEEITAAADEALGGAGLKHRKVHIYDQALGDRVVQRFRDAGWRIDHLVLMILDAHPGGRLLLEVEEVTFDEILPQWIANDLNDNPKLTRGSAAMVAESNRVTAEAIETHYYAASIDGNVAGWCELYLEDGMAQIENVGTHERYRRRGISTSVVTHAVNVAQRSGADLIFLVADNDDWPKEYYGRLGFEPAGFFYEFVIPADDERASP